MKEEKTVVNMEGLLKSLLGHSKVELADVAQFAASVLILAFLLFMWAKASGF